MHLILIEGKHSVKKRTQTKIAGVDKSGSKLTSLERQTIKGGGKMTKNKSKHNHALPKADVEFAEERGNGFEKVALKAQRKQNK